ncbi:MAG: hypothetical protein K2Q20_13595 [Phycisphaerales bacterium]|nr:hypothetical protein [Phycisphaerales bacterium]
MARAALATPAAPTPGRSQSVPDEPSGEPGTHRRHGISVVPPAVHASPASLPPDQLAAIGQLGGETLHGLRTIAGMPEVRFWRPGLVDVAAAMGWWWTLLAPSLMVIASPLLLFAYSGWGAIMVSIYTIKLWILALGIAITLYIRAVRRAVQVRTDPFCIHCGYSLSDAATTRCPECGAAFTPGISDEYRKDPAFFRSRVAALRRLPRSIGAVGG